MYNKSKKKKDNFRILGFLTTKEEMLRYYEVTKVDRNLGKRERAGWDSWQSLYSWNKVYFSGWFVELMLTNQCPISSTFWCKTVRRFKRKHLTAIDCQHLAQSHLAVIQPYSQRWTNRDPNSSLYPRPRTKSRTRGMSSKAPCIQHL